jgi:hypothetical protein
MTFLVSSSSMFCPWGSSFSRCGETFSFGLGSLPPLAVDVSLVYLAALMAVYWKAYKSSQEPEKEVFFHNHWTFSLAAAAA